MHNDDPKGAEDAKERQEDLITQTEAADDTGMVRQQELIVDAELGLPVREHGR
jgi:hypothetical protein